MANEIVNKIIMLCHQNNISVSRLEDDLGFSHGYLAGAGKSNDFPFGRLIKICKYFDVPIWYFSDDIKEDLENRLSTITKF